MFRFHCGRPNVVNPWQMLSFFWRAVITKTKKCNTTKWSEKNRDKLNARVRAAPKIVCVCGGIYTRGGTKRHEQSIMHQNYMS